jgi:VanZ family protein
VNSRLVRTLAWFSLVVVSVATLAPIGLRPATSAPAWLERMAAFAVVGLVFTSAYPRRIWLAVIVTVGTAVLLEILQILTVSRHARVFDTILKLAGGGLGLLIGHLRLRLRNLAQHN